MARILHKQSFTPEKTQELDDLLAQINTADIDLRKLKTRANRLVTPGNAFWEDLDALTSRDRWVRIRVFRQRWTGYGNHGQWLIGQHLPNVQPMAADDELLVMVEKAKELAKQFNVTARLYPGIYGWARGREPGLSVSFHLKEIK